MKLIFEEERKHGHGMEEEIERAISNIGDYVIKHAEDFVRTYFPTTIYVDIPLEVSEDDGEYYLTISNLDNEKWIEWRTIYSDKKFVKDDIINETIATLVMDDD